MLFMEVQSCPGECEEANHKKWIELSHLHLSGSVPYDSGESGYKSGTYELSQVSSSATSVAHLPALIKITGTGKPVPTVIVHETVTTPAGEKPTKIYKFLNCTFTGMDFSGGGSGMGGGGGFSFSYSNLDLEIFVVPTDGADPISKGNIVYDRKEKKFMG